MDDLTLKITQRPSDAKFSFSDLLSVAIDIDFNVELSVAKNKYTGTLSVAKNKWAPPHSWLKKEKYNTHQHKQEKK